MRQLYNAIREMPGLPYEKASLQRGILILSHNMPLRWVKNEDGDFCCPRCGHYVDNFFCPECGQRIWWMLNIRPFDEKRRQHEFRHRDFDYIRLQERREIEQYIRVHGIGWVINRLRASDMGSLPITAEQIRDMASDIEYGPGDEMTPHDYYYDKMMKSKGKITTD